jgi:hypothetical protein
MGMTFRGHRLRPFRLFLLLALVACLIIVALAPSIGGRPSAKGESQIRNQLNAYLSLWGAGWPKQAYGSRKMPAALMDQGIAHYRQVVRQVGTDRFFDWETRSSPFYMMQVTRHADSWIKLGGGHKILTFEYIGSLNTAIANVFRDPPKQFYLVRVWEGQITGSWDPLRKRIVDVWKMDNGVLDKVTMVKIDGVWKIDNMGTLEVHTDRDGSAYGPNTPLFQDPDMGPPTKYWWQW